MFALQPHFIAVIDTHAWNWQALKFTEDKIGEFVNERYGGDINLETSDRTGGGRNFEWKSPEGRKAFALVIGSIVYFTNDESGIDKCLAVKKGEVESIAKNSKVPATSEGRLATGYISPDGIAQISNIAGVSLAMKAGDEGEVKSFIARVLPEMLRKTTQEITWTADAKDGRMDDRLTITMDPAAARVLSETVVPAGSTAPDALFAYIPANASSTTRYSLKDAQIAWRSVLLTAQKQTDAVSGGLIVGFSSSLFEPYAVEDAELFLSGSGPFIATVRMDGEDNAAAIVQIKDMEKLKASLEKEIDLKKAPDKIGNADVWLSSDGDSSVAVVDGYLIAGDKDTVAACLKAKQSGDSIVSRNGAAAFTQSGAVSATFAADTDTPSEVAALFSESKPNKATTSYVTETFINNNGLERRTISDLGFIGSILAQIGGEQ